jgi:amidophosphoribosyltransferase
VGGNLAHGDPAHDHPATMLALRAELVATGLKVDEIRTGIGADSLGYISLDGMVEATRQGRDRLCTACFTGQYPIPLPSPDLLGKHALETPPGAGPAVTDLRAPAALAHP